MRACFMLCTEFSVFEFINSPRMCSVLHASTSVNCCVHSATRKHVVYFTSTRCTRVRGVFPHCRCCNTRCSITTSHAFTNYVAFTRLVIITRCVRASDTKPTGSCTYSLDSSCSVSQTHLLVALRSCGTINYTRDDKPGASFHLIHNYHPHTSSP